MRTPSSFTEFRPKDTAVKPRVYALTLEHPIMSTEQERRISTLERKIRCNDLKSLASSHSSVRTWVRGMDGCKQGLQVQLDSLDNLLHSDNQSTGILCFVHWTNTWVVFLIQRLLTHRPTTLAEELGTRKLGPGGLGKSLFFFALSQPQTVIASTFILAPPRRPSK
ncbi:hypothetical protein PVAG01_10226 [Phlyctema vagabunda]|uniref:Uncharacterized protein n=1 Tax=Phlyctema vagabunda TaxID=108571 RepID=A0ABR4P5D3_9HELO